MNKANATLLLFALGAIFLFWLSNTPEPYVDSKTTTLILKNDNNEPVDVYITLGAVPYSDTALWVQSVYDMFGDTASGLVGKITLRPHQTKYYTPPSNKAVQGNVCFNRQKINCPNGTTVVEFCFNNNNTVSEAQETCEISCVAGVSFISSIDLKGGGIWTANTKGYDTVTHIQNSIIGKNSGRVGVYPFGCDDCDSIANPPRCTKGKAEKPQTKPICNVQRSSSLGGGYIKITYIEEIKLKK